MAASRVVFAGDDASGNRNLWVTDGTSAGTSELTVAGVGSLGLFPAGFTVLGHKALFAGEDANQTFNLWVTNGTSAGTSELTVAGAFSLGLGPIFITTLGSRELFAGRDAGGHYNLWVTDGTSGGTSELTVSGANSGGLFPFGPESGFALNFTLLGGKVLFNGNDANGHINLWVTDGTSVGTSELAVAGEYSGMGGFFASIDPDFTPLGSKVVFAGEDTSFHYSLWVTDGTSAGTSELAVTGARAGGLFAITFHPDLSVFGGKALFEGYDASNRLNLWVTDGTSAGTSELTAAGAYSGGLFNATAPITANFTVFGSKVLFEGVDAGHNRNLWVTDGTSTGTSELAVAGAFAFGGLFSGIEPDFTVLGSKALFAGEDTSGHETLWVTDGSSAGTSELSVAGAYSLGLFYGGFNPQFAVVGNEALFAGFDASHHRNLWVTDGTAAGTSELSASGAASQGLLEDGVVPDFTLLPTMSPPSSDFNGDGASDLLWQDVGGQAAIWELNGTSLIGGGLAGSNPGPSWQVIGSGDFNGDGVSDILWQNTSGQAAVWEMNGTSLIGGGLAGPNPGPSWKVIGAGDFNNDGKSDILWQDASGQAVVWEMSGTNVIGGGLVGPNPGSSWRVVGSGDFNGDGYSDILWQNASGQAAIWEMNGTNVIGGGLVGPNPGPSWQVIGAGDFNNDGKSDILWQSTGGQAAVWEMDGTNVIGGGLVGPNPGASWQVKGSGDFNGDGYSDILWQSTSGQAAVWELNGTNVIGGGLVGSNPGPSWHILAG